MTGPRDTDPLARIRAVVEEVERRSQADARREAGRADTVAEAARRGELGPEWRRVQERVDQGRTTLADVFSGKDTSPDAQALAERSRERVTQLAQAARQDESVAEAVEELDAIRTRVQDALGERRPPQQGGAW
ncbi:hypothetical protein [Cellulomonas soli]